MMVKRWPTPLGKHRDTRPGDLWGWCGSEPSLEEGQDGCAGNAWAVRLACGCICYQCCGEGLLASPYAHFYSERIALISLGICSWGVLALLSI